MEIPITKPCFGPGDFDAVVKPLQSGWVVQGPYVLEFESLFAGYTGARHARAVSSCTAALHLSLKALGIGAGDRVVVPSFTYVATANAVEHAGAEVVFCDIDFRTFAVDTGALGALLAKGDITAVVPVHLFGLSADMPALAELAEKHGCKIVEDAACGLGARIDGRHGKKVSGHAGTFGDFGCFSFHPRKAITTGEGGMVVTGSDELAARVERLRNHGASKSDLARHEETGGALLPAFDECGFNYRLTDIQGALGVAQMQKLDTVMKLRADVAHNYDEALSAIDEIEAPFIPTGYTHGRQAYVALFRGAGDFLDLTKEKIDSMSRERNRLMAALAAAGVQVRQGTHAVHTLGYYRNKYKLNDDDFLKSYAADRLSMALPLYAGMTEAEFAFVIAAIKQALSEL